MISCKKNGDNQPIVEREYSLDYFDEIIVYQGVKVTIHQSNTPYAIVKTTQERIDEVSIDINNSVLRVIGKHQGVFTETYAPVEVHIFTPILTKIRHSGSYLISSEEVLHFPSLALISENFNSDYQNIGNFKLSIDNEQLSVISNGISNTSIDGHTHTLNLSYYSGTGIFDGQNLVAEDIEVFHRGENTLRIYPVQSLSGDLYSVGNLEVYHRPTNVDVTEHYTGQVIFID